jgi:hypothetical protein
VYFDDIADGPRAKYQPIQQSDYQSIQYSSGLVATTTVVGREIVLKAVTEVERQDHLATVF